MPHGTVVERLFLTAAALCLIKPGLLTVVIGLLMGDKSHNGTLESSCFIRVYTI